MKKRPVILYRLSIFAAALLVGGGVFAAASSGTGFLHGIHGIFFPSDGTQQVSQAAGQIAGSGQDSRQQADSGNYTGWQAGISASLYAELTKQFFPEEGSDRTLYAGLKTVQPGRTTGQSGRQSLTAGNGTGSRPDRLSGTMAGTAGQNALQHIQSLTGRKKPQTKPAAGQAVLPDSGNGSVGSAQNSQGPTVPQPDSRHVFIGKQAGYVTPYVLYGDASQLQLGSATGSYMAENYESIRRAVYTENDITETKYTMIMYLCGTDLETGSGGATKSIKSMLSAQGYDPETVNVLVFAGGTNGSWDNSYMSDGPAFQGKNYSNNNGQCNLYYLRAQNAASGPENAENSGDDVINADTLQLLGSYNGLNMGDEKVLAGVLDYAAAEFPAEKYGLFLWNHGGGVNVGVCSTDPYTAADGTTIEHDILTPAKLESALASSALYRTEGKKYSMIGVDACLMGGVEIAYLFSPYCNYMVGSPELTNIDFNYGTFLSAVSAKTHTDAELAETLVPQKDLSGSSGTSTRACYDLTKIQALIDKINKASDTLNELSGDQGYILYDVVKNAKIRSMNYGEDGSRSDAINDGYEYVDIRSFFSNLSEQLGYWISAGQKDSSIISAGTLEKLILTKAAVDAVKAEQDYLQRYDVNYAGVNGGTSGSATEDYTQNLLSNIWGTDIRATSIYLPFFEINDYQSYTDDAILPQYIRLLQNYCAERNNDEARIQKVRTALSENSTFQTLFEINESSGKTETARDYYNEKGELLSGADPANAGTAVGSVLTVNVKSSYDVPIKDPADPESTISSLPYNDLVDSTDTVNVYVLRQKSSDVPGTGGQAAPIDLIYAKQTTPIYNVTGNKDTIHVIVNEKNDLINGYCVKGKVTDTSVPEEKRYVYDWALLQKTIAATDQQPKLFSFNGSLMTWDGVQTSTEEKEFFFEKKSVTVNENKYDILKLYGFRAVLDPTAEIIQVDSENGTGSQNSDNLSVSFTHYKVDSNQAAETSAAELTAPVYGLKDFYLTEDYLLGKTEDYTNVDYNAYTVGITRVSGTTESGTSESGTNESGTAETDPAEYIFDHDASCENVHYNDPDSNTAQVGAILDDYDRQLCSDILGAMDSENTQTGQSSSETAGKPVSRSAESVTKAAEAETAEAEQPVAEKAEAVTSAETEAASAETTTTNEAEQPAAAEAVQPVAETAEAVTSAETEAAPVETTTTNEAEQPVAVEAEQSAAETTEATNPAETSAPTEAQQTAETAEMAQ